MTLGEAGGSDPDGAVSKLPLWRVIKLSYIDYIRHFDDALRLTWLWILLIVGLVAGSDWLRWFWTVGFAERLKAGDVPELGVYPIIAVGLSVLTFLLAVLASLDIAVAWHRRLILGEQTRLSGSTLTSNAPWRYLALLICLILISAVPVLLIFVVDLFDPGSLSTLATETTAAISAVVILLAAFAIFGRLSLVLPARATSDFTLTFKQSWLMTRGNTGRLLAGTFACGFLPYIPLQFLPSSFDAPNFDAAMKDMLITGATPHRVMADAVGRQLALTYQLLTVPIAIGFLSHCYRYFVRRD